MSDFIGDRECVTHHACDCIQAKNRRLRHALELIAFHESQADERAEAMRKIARAALNSTAESPS